MQTHQDSLRYRQDIVLVGGGHAHALVLLQWAMHPFPEARLTLISECATSPYSGMLPGVVAGHYREADIQVDLRRLCQHVGVRFIRAQVTGVDPQAKHVLLEGRPPIGYDVLSINAGITPDSGVAGAGEHAVPVKPIAGFLPRWQAVLEELQRAQTPRTIAVVGGGAGSVELILAMAQRLAAVAVAHRWLLVTRSPQLLSEYPARMRRHLHRRLQRYRVEVREALEIVAVQPANRAGSGPLLLSAATGENIEVDHVFWCTQARPASWLRASGLAVNAQGFLAVNDALQSESHPEVFGAGDCAWMTRHALPRAGVYAVRQAPVLRENLRRQVLGQALQPYVPQRNFLSLLACGERDAVGAKGGLSIAGPWVWRWKDRIDRRFMRMFHALPVLPPLPASEGETLATADERCGGCGGKVGGDILQEALVALDAQVEGDAQLAGDAAQCALAPAEDAAIIALPASLFSDNANAMVPQGAATGSSAANPDQLRASQVALVQSIDAIKPLFDDPWLFARIATVHALSDLFAMHAEPHSAQLLLQLPLLRPRLQQRDLQQVLQGVRTELAAHGAMLAGGHTLEAESLQVGLTVNAFARRDALLGKRGARPGDRLILTKALGTGVLFAAAMRGFSRAAWLDAAIESMLASNAKAASLLADGGARALTDITGFGLAGHLQEMLTGTPVGAILHLQALPVLPGARECLQQGYASTLAPANRRLLPASALRAQTGRTDGVPPQNEEAGAVDAWRYELLFDPQTSGGLLAAVAAEQVDECLQRLQSAGVAACVIGECVADTAGKLQVVCGRPGNGIAGPACQSQYSMMLWRLAKNCLTWGGSIDTSWLAP